MKNNQTTLNLLPNYFKKIGIGIVLTTLLIALTRFIGFKNFIDGKNLFLVVGFDMIIIGTLLYGLAKDKIEDELTFLLRTRAMAAAFIFGTMYAMVQPIIKIFFPNLLELSVQQLVFNMLLFFLLMFTYQKRKMK
jgi:hypothetical protein